MFELRNNRGQNNPMFGRPPTTFIDVTGKSFSKLYVVSYQVRQGFLCLCKCGNWHLEKTSYNLRKGLRVSCGKCNGNRTDRYTKEDDKVIIDNAGILSVDKIGAILKRTNSSVQTRGQILKKRGLINGLHTYGENHHCAKYSNEDVELVRKLHENKFSLESIAEKMEMPFSYVQKIYLFAVRTNDPIPTS